MAGCPVLEEMYMERKWGEDDNLFAFKIVSPSLKRLNLFFNKFLLWVYEVVIDAPKLESLAITDGMSTMYSLTETSALVEAGISFDDFVTEFMTYLSGVKLLTLDSYSIKNLSSVDGSNLPMFSNLVKLEIFIDCDWHLDLLRVLLNKMPNLEHITFMDGPRGKPIYGINWNPPWEAPSCLRLKIKEIIILNQFSVSERGLTFIRYLLKHGVSLERLTINVPVVDPERREELLSIHRGSSLCQIEFV
ncbi:F-box/RNI-like/FBD-like domains-containing protein [Artemisia annua]|uniref:F-box/RNI-like/FBD-like domains-containing protein n=1 Tax=Artemisia annua TaxID=35608 RepID=A0A2U1LW64_ARTAN|nr:F-box/RNI-like/FBD-like domains-containing protein [Artemisia annua]